MPIDPRELYKRIIALLNLQPYGPEDKDKAYPAPPGYGWTSTGALIPLEYGAPPPPGLDVAQLWSGPWAGSEGKPPSWLAALAGQVAQLSGEGREAAYRHAVLGEGVAPEWQPAFANRPAWVTEYYKKLLGSGGGTGAGGGPGHVTAQ